jgi:hypothetical protein
MKDMEESLNKLIEPELIRDYQWEEGKPRIVAQRRDYIHSLSDSVIFHLKRFEVNFDTWQSYKVNDSWSFPFSIDLWPYSKQGLQSKGILGSSTADEDKAEIHSREYFQFELTGVIIHTGSTQSGHYYALVRKSDGTGWLELNDSEVSEFHSGRMADECFGGGVLPSQDFVTDDFGMIVEDTTSQINSKSAYMLVYKRKQALEAPSPSSLPPVLPEVELDNRAHVLLTRLFHNAHVHFLEILIKLMTDRAISNEGDIAGFSPEKIIITSMRVVLELFIYSPHTDTIKKILENLTNASEVLSQAIQEPLNNQIEDQDKENIDMNNTTEGITQTNVDLVTGGFLYASGAAIEKVGSVPTIEPSDADLESGIGSNVNATASAFEIGDDVDQETAAAIALSLQLNPTPEHSSSTMSMNVETVGTTSKRPYRSISNLSSRMLPSTLILEYFLHNMEDFMNTLFSDDKMIRLAICDLAASAFVMTVQNVPGTIFVPLSCGGQYVDSKTDAFGIAPRFLEELTQPERVRQLAYKWRYSNAMQKLLLRITKSGWGPRDFLIRKRLPRGLLEAFLGDAGSPDMSNYVKVPSSYVNIPPVKPGEPLPSNARLIPDWCDMLETLVILVECTEPKACRDTHQVSPVFLKRTEESRALKISIPLLDLTSEEYLNQMTFWNTCMLQARYREPFMAMLRHLYPYDLKLSDNFCEHICSTLSSTTLTGIGYLFELLDSFLGITDNYTVHRANCLFGSNGTVISIAQNKTSSNPQIACVMIQCISLLISKYEVVRDAVRFSSTVAGVHGWAPWMLKFCFQFKDKCERDTLTSVSLNDNEDSSSSDTKGVYLYIFGEEESMREITWVNRANTTFLLLQEAVRKSGGNPDLLIPTDAFSTELPVEQVAGRNPYPYNTTDLTSDPSSMTMTSNQTPFTNSDVKYVSNELNSTASVTDDYMSEEKFNEMLASGKFK